jgi:hypothetical protein
MVRKVRVLALTLGFGALACGGEPSPTEISFDHASPVVAADPGPAAIEYQLLSFDVATRIVTAESRVASVCDKFAPTDPCRFRISVGITSDSWFQAANTDQFAPVDPCRDLAVNYNTIVIDTPPDGAIAALTAQGCNARILIDQKAGTIRTFQPVP